MKGSGIKTPQAVEIELLEELVERSHAYLWHFAMAHEKESVRLMGEPAGESWKVLKHQKQKQIYRQCLLYCEGEAHRGLAKIWAKRLDRLYARADFDGLLQLRRHIEVQSFKSSEYIELLKKRHHDLQNEITAMRESIRRLRVNIIREKQLLAPRVL